MTGLSHFFLKLPLITFACVIKLPLITFVCVMSLWRTDDRTDRWRIHPAPHMVHTPLIIPLCCQILNRKPTEFEVLTKIVGCQKWTLFDELSLGSWYLPRWSRNILPHIAFNLLVFKVKCLQMWIESPLLRLRLLVMWQSGMHQLTVQKGNSFW